MSIVSIQIPQIGEGLQEARLVGFLKQPGDRVKRDEPIYQMETDKAVMDVESPVDGILVEWIAKVDDIIAIGAEVATVQIESSETPSATPAPAQDVALPTITSDLAPITIPQIGEGLQEARVVAFLVQPGETITRDMPIYQMETDKAVMDVESPVTGVLVEWKANVDDVLEIGAEIGIVKLTEGSTFSAPAPHGSPAAATGPTVPPAPEPPSVANVQGIPPRTRAYAKEKGIPDSDLAKIPASGSKLMPDDIDAYLSASKADSKADAKYSESPLSGKQRVLNSRMVRSNSMVIPGTMTVVANWEVIERERARIKASGTAFQPSAFTMFAFCVAQSLRDFPAFRSTLQGDDKKRTYNHAQLGIAVGLPEDQLVLAVVENADALSWSEFATAAREKIELARSGKDQANEAVTVSLTNMQSFGLREAVPVVVAPSVATIFLGEVYNSLANDTSEIKVQRSVNLTMTFDHRLANGVGAAEFLNAIKTKVESISSVIGAEGEAG